MRQICLGFMGTLLFIGGCGATESLESVSGNTRRLADELEYDRKYVRNISDRLTDLSFEFKQLSGLVSEAGRAFLEHHTSGEGDATEDDEVVFTPEQISRLTKGEQVEILKEIEGKSNKLMILAHLVPVMPEEFVALWTDFDSAKNFLNFEKSKEIGPLEDEPLSALVEYIAIVDFFGVLEGKIPYEVEYRFHEPDEVVGYVVDFQNRVHKKSLFRENIGTLTFSPVGENSDQTLLVSSSYTEVKGVPFFLVARDIRGNVQKMVNQVLKVKKENSEVLKKQVARLKKRF